MVARGHGESDGTEKQTVSCVARSILGVDSRGSMFVFAYDGVSSSGQVPPDLMGSAGLGSNLEEGSFSMDRKRAVAKHAPVGLAGLAV